MEGRRAVVIGYYTYITGDGEIVPPLDDTTLQKFGIDEGGYLAWEQEPGDESVSIVDGRVAVVGTNPGRTAIKFGYEESIKEYDFNDQVKELATLCKERNLTFNATFNGDGEEDDDFWKLTVTDNEVLLEGGSIFFPSDLEDIRADAWDEAHRTICTLVDKVKDCHTNPHRSP